MKYPVLYIHGANCTPDSFIYLIAGMPESHRFDYVMYDVQNESLDEIMATVRSEVVSLGEPVHIVGHSLGGIFAVNAAHDLPELVESVTTLATPFGGIELPLMVRWARWYSTFVYNMDPNHTLYKRAQSKPTGIPMQAFVTTSGHNPLLGSQNDGVVSLTSQSMHKADHTHHVPWNHFEVLMHPSIREQIIDFISEAEKNDHK